MGLISRLWCLILLVRAKLWFIYFFKQSLCSDFTVLLLDLIYWKIKSGYKFCKMFITIYLVKITLFYVFISCRFKLNVLVLYKNMFHLRTTIFLSTVCCSVHFI